jgi:long-chain acyl-CoA synthetase
MNLAQTLAEAASHFHNRPLFRYNRKDYAFDSVMDQTQRLAYALRERGVKRGDRVLLLAKNKPEWVITMLAALRAGAIVVPVNPALTASEVGYIIEHSAPVVAVVDAELSGVVSASAAKPIVIEFAADGANAWSELVAQGKPAGEFEDCQPNDPAVIFYTSGTTGRPKGVLLAHSALLTTADITSRNFHLRPDDISLIPNSLSFIYPLVINCFGCIRSGATVVLQDRFHPELALRAIEQERVTIFMGVPTMYTMMLNWAEEKQVNASSLRLCVAAGSSLSWGVVARFKERFGAPLYDLWGQTEGTPITSYDPAIDAEGRPDSCGRPLAGCKVRIVDDSGNDLPAETVGEVLLAGPNVMLEYYKNPAATADTLRDGWIYTGDLGRLDADGYLYIVGRKRDMIIRGGANIYPVEIEDALYTHPSILECAVIGIPDELYGERVKAFVVLKAGQSAASEELRQHCKQRLAEYKVPSDVEFIDELPKGPTGKILKRVLVEVKR